jgi:two-component system chemotaxis response regulator CheB
LDQASPIVVIGASMGGVEAVLALAAALPPDFAAAVFVVLHIGARRSELPWLLNQQGPLRAQHPADGDPIHAGRIYVAPPDHHLLVEHGHVRLTRGPRENWVRPAVDPLFRSAARAYGAGVIGVILTGGLNDGTAGLFEIKQRGGITVVQEPSEAADPSMPRSAAARRGGPLPPAAGHSGATFNAGWTGPARSFHWRRAGSFTQGTGRCDHSRLQA